MPSRQGCFKFENFICFEVGHGTRNCFCMIVGVGKSFKNRYLELFQIARNRGNSGGLYGDHMWCYIKLNPPFIGAIKDWELVNGFFF